MQIVKLSTTELNTTLKNMSVIDQAFFDVYSGRISECDDATILRFLADHDSVDLMEGYTHLMDTYIAFRAGIAFANKQNQ
jgi:hypothetical protein